MKILFLSDDFPPQSFGGAGIVAYNLAQGLKHRGHEIFVITTVQNKSAQGNEEREGLKIFRIFSDYHIRWQAYSSLYNPQTVSRVGKIIEEIVPDIVHAHNVHQYLSYHCLKMAKKYAKGVFLTAHDTMLFSYGKLMPKNGKDVYKVGIFDLVNQARKRYNPLRNIAIRHYLRYVDKVFTISDSLKKALELNNIANTETIYNGIAIDEWIKNSEKIENFRKKYGLQDKKIILFGGRLSGAKGGEVILRAVALTAKTIKNTFLLVAGIEDWYARKMAKLADELGIAGNVRFTGWLDRDEMKCAFFASDVCVTPSIYLDPFNLFNIEAGAAKKPVVGTCFGGTPEIVIDNKTGYIVNPLNAEAMSGKIIDLLKNVRKSEEFGQNAYKRVKELFSLDKQIEKTLNWYKKFL